MDQRIEDLLSILEEESMIYGRLLLLTREATDVIINNDIAALDNNNRMQESLLTRIIDLERRRYELISVLTGDGEQDGDRRDITIEELIKRYPPEVADRLRTYRKDMMETIESLSEAVNRNATLISHSLSYINFSKSLLTGSAQEKKRYTKEGKAEEEKSLILDKKV